jgi:competence protein ComEA
MSTPRELDDPFLATGELPARPSPPRTWRDRLGDLVAGLAPIRIIGGAALLAVAAVVGWRMLAPPATPPEVSIPFTEQPASDSEGDGGPAGSTGKADAGTDAGSGAPTTTADAAGTRPPGDATAGELVVHVVGAVVAPGVQRLPAGSRVVDAVDAAGGAAPDADLGRVNLASPLSDGQQVYVLRVGEVPPVPAPSTGSGGPGGTVGSGAGDTAASEPINVNTAPAAELEELPGVGPTTAQAIIDHREQHGPFTSVDDLLDVRGIGEAKLEQIRDRATV